MQLYEELILKNIDFIKIKGKESFSKNSFKSKKRMFKLSMFLFLTLISFLGLLYFENVFARISFLSLILFFLIFALTIEPIEKEQSIYKLSIFLDKYYDSGKQKFIYDYVFVNKKHELSFYCFHKDEHYMVKVPMNITTLYSEKESDSYIDVINDTLVFYIGMK